MTPEEKAISLLNTLISEGTDRKTAKKAAIIALTEVLTCVEWPYTLYYQEVKGELEKVSDE
jgi:hypothetical protein